MDALLDVTTAPAYLRRRGVLPTGLSTAADRCVELGGGVSNVVLLVEAGGQRVVLKQSLGRLRVADTWEAPVERILTEARALRFAAGLLPVPAVLDVDAAGHAMTVQAAPATWISWKERLLAGDVDPRIATRLGAGLGALHSAPVADAEWLDQQAAFHALRVDPYHNAVAQRLPAVAPQVHALTAAMAARQVCFVHGDYSPKNVLVGPDGLWVIDFEVAHRGDPTFDVAFLLHHLLLKGVHRPADRTAYRHCADAFLRAYAGCSVHAGLASGPHLVAHVACLLLARAVGKSPAEYLDDAERDAVTAVAQRALVDEPDDVGWFWEGGR